MALPDFLQHLAPLLDRYGYLAIAGMVGVEGFGLPAPGQTMLVAAAVYAGTGRLNIIEVAAVGVLAAVVGDNLGYLIGRVGGRRLLVRYGRPIGVTPARVDHAQRFFGAHGFRIVVAARFIDGLRQVNGLMAGVTAMSWRRFVGYDAVGAALWVGLWTTLGHLAGSHIAAVSGAIHRYQWFAPTILAVGVAGYVTVRVRRHRPGTG